MSNSDLTAAEIERARDFVSLLRAYGQVQNQPTTHELWVGCKDAAPLIENLLAALDARTKERDDARSENLELEKDKRTLETALLCEREKLRAALAAEKEARPERPRTEKCADGCWQLRAESDGVYCMICGHRKATLKELNLE